MKKVIIKLLLLLPAAAGAQVHFNLEGRFTKPENIRQVYLSYYTAEGNMLIDSATLTFGKFKFTGKLIEPAQGLITFVHKGENYRTLKKADYTGIMLDECDINISGKDSLSTAKISGSPMVKDFVLLEKAKLEQDKRLDKKYKDFLSTPKQLQDLKGFKLAYDTVFQDVILQKRNLDFQYIANHHSSYLSLILVSGHMAGEPIDTLEKAVNSMPPSLLKDTRVGSNVTRFIDSRKSINVGGHVPDFSIPDTLGKTVNFSVFKGKYVLIDFWASWCKPCRAENPNLLKAYDQYKDKNFTILSISVDIESARNAWLKAIKADHIGEWTHASSLSGTRGNVATLFRINEIPQNWLVDPNGVVIGKNLRGEELQKKLSEIIHD